MTEEIGSSVGSPHSIDQSDLFQCRTTSESISRMRNILASICNSNSSFCWRSFHLVSTNETIEEKLLLLASHANAECLHNARRCTEVYFLFTLNECNFPPHTRPMSWTISIHFRNHLLYVRLVHCTHSNICLSQMSNLLHLNQLFYFSQDKLAYFIQSKSFSNSTLSKIQICIRLCPSAMCLAMYQHTAIQICRATIEKWNVNVDAAFECNDGCPSASFDWMIQQKLKHSLSASFPLITFQQICAQIAVSATQDTPVIRNVFHTLFATNITFGNKNTK